MWPARLARTRRSGLTVTEAAAHQAIEAVFRIEAARIIAGVARMVRDVGLAEELAQDALVAALETWPNGGIPDNPGAWLMATAKNRALDRLRQRKLHAEKEGELTFEIESLLADAQPRIDARLDDDIGDDLLRLVFTACHPVLSTDARVALTLRLLGGLTTDEIARAFLVPEATIAQRIVRAKRTLAEARVPFEVPRASERAERLASVLAVIYLVFNEGYSATSGEHWTRPTLCEDALRLGRILAELAPSEAEVHGLVALMEIQASRLRARVNAAGEPILLLDQNRARWDHLLVRSRPAPPTGRGSPRSTTRSPPCRPLPSWNSTGPWRWRWPSVPPPDSRSSTSCATTRRSRAITSSRACAAMSSRGSAVTRKRRRNSGGPPSSRATSASVPSCSPAQRRPRAADRSRLRAGNG